MDDKSAIDGLKSETQNLKKHESLLENTLNSTREEIKQMTDDSSYLRRAYVTFQDIRSLPSFKDQTLIAIKAPPKTRLEVPDPDEGMKPGQRRYQIFLTNESGAPIDVYLIPEEQTTLPPPSLSSSTPLQTFPSPLLSSQFVENFSQQQTPQHSFSVEMSPSLSALYSYSTDTNNNNNNINNNNIPIQPPNLPLYLSQASYDPFSPSKTLLASPNFKIDHSFFGDETADYFSSMYGTEGVVDLYDEFSVENSPNLIK